MILVVSTDSNTARIYRYEKRIAKVTLLKEITHPESKLKNIDLTSDRPGHYKAGAGRGAYSPHKQAKEVEIDNFSREIAKELNRERVQHEYDGLIVISPPHMIGLLSQHLDKNVKGLIINSIPKDLIHFTERELAEFLKKNTQFADTP